MSLEVAIRISYISIFSPLIPLACLFIYRKKQPRQNLILSVSLFISFLFDIIGWILAYKYRENAISNNLYFIIAFPAIMWFYHETLMRKSFRLLIRIFTVLFFSLAIILTLEHGMKTVNANILTLSSVLVTITSLLFVADLNLMDDSKFLNNRFHETNIMLNTSLALYYFITIAVFIVFDYFFAQESSEVRRSFWAFHNLLNISKNIGITVAFYQTARRNLERST